MAPLSLALSFLLLPALSFAQDATLHVPLARRSWTKNGAIDYSSEADRMRYRYGYAPDASVSSRAFPRREAQKRASDIGIPIVNQVSENNVPDREFH